MSKTWRIPVTWEVDGMLFIEADTLEEAMEIAKDESGEIPLPEGNYVDDSWRLAETDTELVREVYNNNQKDSEVE